MSWSEHSILISSTRLPRNLFIRKLCLIEIVLTSLSSVSLQFITTSGEGGRWLSGSWARIHGEAPHPLPLSSCCLCGRGIESWPSHREAGQLVEQRRELCSRHPPRGPIWDYPAAASDACVSTASTLFCCHTAPRRERTHWSPAAVEQEAWAVCSGLCCLSVCRLSPLSPAPFLLKPPRMSHLWVGSAVTFLLQHLVRGGGIYTPFSLHLGSLVCMPWTGWKWGIRDSINPWSHPSGPPRPSRVLLFPS